MGKNISHTKEELTSLMQMPLKEKIQISIARIIEWYETWGGQVYVAFSGGKDSTVLLDLVRKIYPNVPAVFCNTGLEFSELQHFVKQKDNVITLRPKMMFTDVIKNYGYPLISKEVSEAIYYARRIAGKNSKEEADETPRKPIGLQSIWKRMELGGGRPNCSREEFFSMQFEKNEFDGRIPNKDIFSNTAKSQFNKEKWLPLCQLPIPISHYCCNIMKKSPSKKFAHKEKRYAYLGVMTSESRIRKQAWLRHGCNAFESSNPQSSPIAFWTDQDVLEYIAINNLSIASIYGEVINNNGKWETTGYDRSGCIFCCYGLHNEKGETRIQKLAKTHPRQYEYCLGGGQWVDNPAYDEFAPEYDGEWKNWNPKQIWIPSKEGLGLKQVFDMVNEIYGKDFYRYE